MKKSLFLLNILMLILIIFSCSKPSTDLTPIDNSGSGTSTGGGTGSGGTGSGGTGSGGGTGVTGGGGGSTTNGGVFSANFKIDVPDIYNIYETAPVKLVATGSGIKSYKWSFGDGRRSTSSNVSVTYPYHGYYTVTLTVEDANGKTETQSQSFSVLCNFGGGIGGGSGH